MKVIWEGEEVTWEEEVPMEVLGKLWPPLLSQTRCRRRTPDCCKGCVVVVTPKTSRRARV